jgi:hypothetical protein
MSTHKNILKIVPGLQATSLALNATQLIPKFKGNKVKPVSMKKFVKVGVGSLIGISLLKPTSQMINDLD